MTLLRTPAPMWCAIGGGLTQLGLLIAIGDGATELLYWQIGDPHADHAQMIALAQRYENAAGGSLPYHARWPDRPDRNGDHYRRAVADPRSATVGRAWPATGIAANIGGFAIASKPLLLVSYVLVLIAFAPAAVAIMRKIPEPSVSAALARTA